MQPSRRRGTRRLLLALCGVAAAVFGLLCFGAGPGAGAGDDDVRLELRQPEVPANVIVAVGNAERDFYRGLAPPRRLLEDAQDQLCAAAPRLAYGLNFSVGEYRVKPKAVHDLVDYAMAHDYLRVDGSTEVAYEALLPGLARHHHHSEWQVALLLQHLKDSHPQLSAMGWEQIAADPNAIATLYSGYTGAGGAMEQWRSDCRPGEVARERLGYDPVTGAYAGIPPR